MAQDYAARGYITITELIPFSNKTANFQMLKNEGYIANHATAATRCDGALPTSATTGDVVVLMGKENTGFFRITQIAGQQMRFPGGLSTQSGAGGHVTATQTYQSITLRSLNAALEWEVIQASGLNWTVI